VAISSLRVEASQPHNVEICHKILYLFEPRWCVWCLTMSEKAFPLADADLTIALLDLVQQATNYKQTKKVGLDQLKFCRWSRVAAMLLAHPLRPITVF
jgi:hypothetical protein